MSTANYKRNYFSNVYAVLDNDYNEYDQDIFDMDYQELKDNLLTEIENEFKRNKRFTVSENNGDDGDRNCTGNYVFEVSTLDGIEIVGKINNGYYGGCNLEIDLMFNGEKYDSIEYIIEDYSNVFFYWNDSYKKVPEKRIRKDFNRIVSGIEKVYEKLSTPLMVQGVFSNGEAVYKAL